MKADFEAFNDCV